MNIPVFTYAVICLTVITSIAGFANQRMLEKNVFSIQAIIRNKEVYRLLTSQLFHVNWIHLIFNMVSFYSFSVSIESAFGPMLTAAIYLASALGGDIVALLIRRKDPDYSAVGASGAVCGIIFSSIFLLPGGSIIIFPLPVPLPSWVYAILFMAVSLYGIGRGATRIGHEAHIGGALAGMAVAVAYMPSILHQNGLLLAGLTLPVIIILIILLKTKNRSEGF
jgi:membrane associated rhomboid family serine protease